jgi:hypothetical protein
MTQPRRAKLISAAMNASFVGAVMAGCALGVAATAGADDNCDPFMLSMTPQPVLSCQAPDVAPPPDAPAPSDAPTAFDAPAAFDAAPAPVIPPAPDAEAFGAAPAPEPLWPQLASGD